MFYELRKNGQLLKRINAPVDEAGVALPKKEAIKVVMAEARQFNADWILTSDHNDIQVYPTSTPKPVIQYPSPKVTDSPEVKPVEPEPIVKQDKKQKRAKPGKKE